MKKGTSTFEYAMLMIIIVLAVTVIFNYTKRAICGKLRESADVFGFGRQ